MLSPTLLRRIRRIELRTKRLVHSQFAGAYHAIYKGKGLAFASVRPYLPGDDIRRIDWKVTARSGEPFVKEYVEERELTVLLLMDASASLLFGTVEQQKRDFAAEFGAVIAMSATTNHDRAGVILFSDHIEHVIPPRKGRNHILRLIRDMLTFTPQGKGTNLALALRTAHRTLRHGAIVFILSDFLLDHDSYRRELAHLARYHQVNAVVLSDPLEDSFPSVGLMGLRDAESGELAWVDTSSKTWQRQFRQQRDRLRQQRDDLLNHIGVQRIDIPPDGDYVQALMRFYQRLSQWRK